MNVLEQQYNLTSRPVLRRSGAPGASASEGVVIHFSRKLPSDVLKKPKDVSGYATMRRQRGEEFEPELPIEGSQSGAEAAAAAAGRGESKKDTDVFIDKRHTSDIDRAAIMAKLRGATSRVVVPNVPPSFSSKFAASSGDEGVGRSEIEPDFGIEISDEAAATAPIKLGKRAFLPSDEPVKQSKASAALAIADANKDTGFEEIRPFIDEAVDPGETGAESAAPKKRVIRIRICICCCC